MEVTSRQTLIVVDPNLKDELGHHFEYDYSLMQGVQRRGWGFRALGHVDAKPSITNRMPVERAFPLNIWDRHPKLATIRRIGVKLDLLLTNYQFYQPLKAALNAQNVGPNDVVFGHMIILHQLVGWSWWYQGIPVEKRPRLVLLFRYASEWVCYDRLAKYAFRNLIEAGKDGKLVLCSDSNRLAADYEQTAPQKFEVFPIPHTTHPLLRPQSSARSSATKPLRMVSPGNAREEKGFQEILKAIILLHEKGTLKNFHFILQCNDTSAAIQKQIDDLKKLNLPQVEFVAEIQSSDEYCCMVQEADVVLAPYWPHSYVARTSGIFTEALAAGKPVIVTENTWMADQLKGFGGGVQCRCYDVPDLARAMEQMHSEFETHVKRAAATCEQWTKVHNPEAFLDRLLGDLKTGG